jgi:hypothetical protein
MLSKIKSISPTSGPVGTSITVTGSGFTGATKVTVGGKSGSFTVNSSTQITVTVPIGAQDRQDRIHHAGRKREQFANVHGDLTHRLSLVGNVSWKRSHATDLSTTRRSIAGGLKDWISRNAGKCSIMHCRSALLWAQRY